MTSIETRPPLPKAPPGPPVRVLFVSSHAQLGGGEAYLRSIVEGVGPDWTAGIVVLHDGPFVARLRDGGHDVSVIDAPGRDGIPRAARFLRAEIKRTRPDVIHANNVKAAIVAALATLGGGPPVVWLKIDFGWDGVLARVTAQRCAQVVGISEAVHETFGPRGLRRTRVVHCGIQDFGDTTRRGHELLERSLGSEIHGPVVALSGRLCPGKGQVDLLRAGPAILAAHPDAKLLFVGVPDTFFPDFQDGLEALAEELGIAHAVRYADLPGHSPGEAVALVSACDVLAVPSQRQEGGWREGFGLVAAEAMQVGTPIVAYRSGALGEVVADCGLLVPEGDVDGLGAAIVRVLDDEELRAGCIARGRVRAREHFTLERVVREMAGCYRDAACAR